MCEKRASVSCGKKLLIDEQNLLIDEVMGPVKVANQRTKLAKRRGFSSLFRVRRRYFKYSTIK